jgi:tyrosine-protein phosphatase SIW14
LILEDYPEQNKAFLEENKIRFFQFGVAGNKEPFVDISEATICQALTIILDKRNHPSKLDYAGHLIKHWLPSQ